MLPVETYMPRIQTIFVAFLVFSLVLASPAKTQGRNKQRKARAAAAPVQPQNPSIVDLRPAPPPTPEQGPSSPPEVSFQNGQLTIVARNSTMSDVLNAVKQKTGAAVDMPTVSSERVVGRFGPGAARDVMAQLLNGSHYDYVLVGSPADPGALEKVVLMARVSGPQPTPQSVPPVQAANPVPVYAEQPLAAVPDVEADSSQDDTGGESPVMPPDVQQGQDDQSQQPERQGLPMVKTPEQLLRELQQQQQQQQEQNVQPGVPGQPPQ
ncbi:MAG TPA: hypothetical protein VM711_11160 [Sphingomicrobium sp.]|nr:hypothetical protein [Sphingomicrobium sp.]